MNNPVCPKTGAPMHRGMRPIILTYENKSTTFEMPGWYCHDCDEGIHTGEDMKVSDLVLEKLKNEQNCK
jgi:HTH-type transcriptional regulator/antitoxin MqsA